MRAALEVFVFGVGHEASPRTIYIHKISHEFTQNAREISIICPTGMHRIFSIQILLHMLSVHEYKNKMLYKPKTTVPFTLQNLLSHYIGTHAYSTTWCETQKTDCAACRWTFHCKIFIYTSCALYSNYIG